MFTVESIYPILKNGIVTVTFNKVDGSERVMRCTLNDAYLPEEHRGKGYAAHVTCAIIDVLYRDKVDYMDVSPRQMVSVATPLVMGSRL
jgi:DNA-directed RNA polymerase beta subunit